MEQRLGAVVQTSWGAIIDDVGNRRSTGRAKDLVESGREWINPVEMEEIVGRLPLAAAGDRI